MAWNQGLRWWVVIGFLFAWWVAPGVARAAGLSTTEPRRLEPPSSPIVASHYSSQIACGSIRCVTFYVQPIDSGVHVYASRIDGVAGLTDWPRIHLGEIPSESDYQIRAAGALGDEFIAVLDDGVFRLSGATANVENVTADFPEGLAFALVGGDETWLYLYEDDQTGSLMGVVLDRTDLSPLAEPFEVPLGQAGLGVVVSDGQYLLTGFGAVVRVDTTTGDLLDPLPVSVSAYNVGAMRGAYKDGVYQLAWANGGDLFGARIRADGVVLDPDDHFNEISGARLLCSQCDVVDPAGLWVDVVGDDVFAGWLSDALDTLQGVRIDVATGGRVTGSASAPELSVTVPQTLELELGGTFGVGMTWSGRIYGLEVSSSPALVFTVGAEQPIALRTERLTRPAAAWNGQNFVVAYCAGSQVRVMRIDPNTGEPLSGPPLVLGTAPWLCSITAESLAKDGSTLVAWTDSTNRLQRRLVKADGTLGPALTPPLATSATDPRLIENGEYYFSTWRTIESFMGVRLDATGAPVGSVVALANSSGMTGYSTVADLAPVPSLRTFLTVLSSQSNRVYARRLRSATGVLISSTTTVTADATGPVYTATGGVNLLLTYRNAAGTAQWGTFVDAVSGNAVAGTAKELLATLSGEQAIGVWHDGSAFLVAFAAADSGGGARDVYVRRYSESLTDLDPATPGTGTLVAEELELGPLSQTAIAANGAGRAILVGEIADPVHGSNTLVSRFIDNDAASEPVDPPAVPAGAPWSAIALGALLAAAGSVSLTRRRAARVG